MMMKPLEHANNRNHGKKKVYPISPMLVLSHVIVAVVSFQAGISYGGSFVPQSTLVGENGVYTFKDQAASDSKESDGKEEGTTSRRLMPSLFTENTKKFLHSAALTPRNDFVNEMNLGFPIDETGKGNKEVLILYASDKVEPTNADPINSNANDKGLPIYKGKEAIENCQVLHLVLTQPGSQHQCIAVMGQWESYHVHKFMRLPEGSEKKPGKRGTSLLKPEHKLRYVSRLHKPNGGAPRIPTDNDTRTYWKDLANYLTRLDSTIARLKPIADKAAGGGKTVIVMVCNFGQSELLFNFVCSAKARGLDLSKVLLFATDDEIAKVAEGLGINYFHVKDEFGPMPERAARAYADKAFTGMMMAKVYCVHLINHLGYDVLFQDVDLVWFKEPLDYFNSKEAGTFDFYFQDDGARTNRYSPYSPNSGFYYVRYNERTRYFFSELTTMGDLILESGSHQSVLNLLLEDHASSRGVTVKILGRDTKEGRLFPGGFHYHQRRNFMKDLANKKEHPYIFHMSWTLNKANKRLYMQQMGDWYVKDGCAAKKVHEMEGVSSLTSLANDCCSAEAIVVCSYRDKPSIIPCKESPPIDKGRPSFW